MFKGKKLTKEVLATIKNSQLRDKLAETERAALAMVYLNTNRFVTVKHYNDKSTLNVPTLGIYQYKTKDEVVADQHAVDKILCAAQAWAVLQINK